MKKDFYGDYSRRDFMRLGARTAASSAMLMTLGGFQRVSAAVADTSGYKALVCVYLTGGNNGFNTVVPLTPAANAIYAASRSNLALSKSILLPLLGTASDGNAYGLHPSCLELQTLFNTGRLAVVGNVGTLVQPTTLAQAKAGSVPLPLQLFSHLDQRTAWWTSVPNRAERSGWAGRIADLYVNQGFSPRLAMNINVGGANYWQEGRTAMPYVLGTSGAPTLVATSNNYRNGRRAQTAQALINQAANDPSLMVGEFAGIETNAGRKVTVVNDSLSAAGNLLTPFPRYNGDNDLGAQLHEVARCIKAHAQIGDSRQMFFVQIGGFDTHNNELATQANLLRIVSQNLNSFWLAMNEIGQQNNVTTFTASDFGRSLGSNGDGSDHAWGNHHLVMGGAVKSGFYGKMPSLALNGPDDIGNGRILPTTSTDQYAATMARWFGVNDADLNSVFPNLANFSLRNLGFLG